VASIVAEMRSRGIPSRRIVLAGFSQGGVIALHLGLRHREPLGGIMALSTYVHDAEHLTDEISLENIDVPIFMAHGVLDPMIPITRAITSRETLRALNYDVEWHEYRMGHSVCPQEVADIARWMSARFPPTAG
jgi:phospholipase/carboxylesterase